MKFHEACVAIMMAILCLGVGAAPNLHAGVIRKDDRVFLEDRTGETWDITQAVSIGFDPYGFQFGIGRHAIPPLDGSELESNFAGLDPEARVIGVENRAESHAYVIRRLTRHEIANTLLGETPIAAAY